MCLPRLYSKWVSSDRRCFCTAYGDVMKLMLIAATVLAAVPFLLAFGLPNWYLGDQQNAVEATDLKGERAPDAEKSSPV